jgi:hypothetical protein
MRVFLMFVVVASLCVGCRSSEREAIEAKCDASLRQQAEERVRAGDETPLEVLGRADGPIDPSERGKLEKAGATLDNVTEDLFAARIAPRHLGQVASLDFVRSLALSQTRDPLNR